MSEEELQEAAAKPADAVVENQVSALRLLGGVIGVMGVNRRLR